MLNKKGFTLMEVMTAISIIAIISGPLLYMFTTSTRVGRWSYDTDKANTVAVRTVEELKADPSAVSLDESGLYSHVDYYSFDWQPSDSSTAAFSAVTTAEGAGSGSVGRSYIPSLTDDDGNLYAIEINYGESPATQYTLTVTAQPLSYQVQCSSSVLTVNGLTGSLVSIPRTHCASALFPIIPIVVNDGQNSLIGVRFHVDNTSGAETALYVYGDYDEANPENHLVTASPLAGTMSINYMKVQNSFLQFDELKVNVQVLRLSDANQITDYTTKVYLAG